MVDLSVIIPAFNMEKYIERSVRSALSQNELDVEVIIINDGSSDNTVDIVNRIYQNEPRVKLISQNNTGPYKARRKGIDVAGGYYITFIDADDYIDVDFYADLIKKMKEEDIDILEYGYRKVSENAILFEKEFTESYRDRVEAGKKIITKFNSSCSNCNKIYHSKCLKKLSLDEEVITHEEDMLLNLKALENLKKYYVTDRIGYNYYNRENSSSTSPVDEKYILNALKTWSYIYDYVNGFFREISKECAVTYCARLALYYCVAINNSYQPQNYEWLITEFERKYKENELSKYQYKYESIKRKIMLCLFHINPKVCSRLYQMMSKMKMLR